jgi:hypothetical protein
VISATENSNKFQKTRFWKEKSVEDVVTLGPMAQATLVDMIEYIVFLTSTRIPELQLASNPSLQRKQLIDKH